MNYRRLFIQGTHVFLTIVTYNRQPILIKNVDCLRNAFKETKEHFDFEILAITILPEHFHILLRPKNILDYPKIIKSIKYNFSNKFNNVGLASPTYIIKREKQIWQRRYFEHTIRDEDDLCTHLDYIHYNPVKHGLTQNVKDWEFSSFYKFVKMGNYEPNWGSYDDIIKFEKLDYEPDNIR